MVVTVRVKQIVKIDLFEKLFVLYINSCNHTTVYKLFVWDKNMGGARGVMVIVVGNGHGDTSSNPGRDWLHFT